MSQPAPDLVLRRLVAQLAVLHPDDVGAVLEELDVKERRRVEVLLLSYAGGGAKQEAPVAKPDYDRSRVSAWLRVRIDASQQDVTPHARETLSHLAKQLFPASDEVKTARSPPSLVSRMVSALFVGAGAV